mmetsp:Transcript_2580/g.4412  ORF Transcript_2580/g.4412 Transcript_2580/m.4412 type:complete len:243 (-) Transcript_2580:445-1173(-)|eukprot:CAMPEP_0119312896 /NCGR_PEP_ID=MMETSP1333-20130426/27158_1 /TAXON_ID=418940 /ORGANISM="Scyphosphaera apsteinii, Strain RCC1455" /LENGTH=242 /DNA_ID=CAMNT_0007317589 /DNA_START=111 /DNA_END=839 /DNA_ORIENTATION=+
MFSFLSDWFWPPDDKSKLNGPVKLTYFPVFAKGPSVALALEHCGLHWEGAFPANWPTLKPTTPWGHLPLLELPDGSLIGHEGAILNWIARQKPVAAGATDADKAISDQLYYQAEDIYAALAKHQATCFAQSPCTEEERSLFWASSDQTKHNKKQGLSVFLLKLDEFHKNAEAPPGRFTSTGVTVGECKLFAILHMLVLIQPDVLAPYSMLSKFYDYFASLEPTKAVLADGAKMPSAFSQYFL